MPFVSSIDTAKCPVCSRSVYAAEERCAGGHKYHRACFKCSMCSKLLDSTNCTEHDHKLFCTKCHGRRYGPKGYGFGSGAGTLSMDTGSHIVENSGGSADKLTSYHYPQSQNIVPAADGTGCPRCGGEVYQAEQMLAKGRGWHKHCFSCADCNKKLDSLTHNDGPNGEIYCKLCYSRHFGPKGYGYGQGAGALQMSAVSGRLGDQFNNDITVDPSMGAKAAPGEGCPRCGYAVYAAEKMPVKNRVYHKKCFNCKECKKSLDSVNACDGPDEEVHCRTCYAKRFGPRGVGYGMGAGVLSMG